MLVFALTKLPSDSKKIELATINPVLVLGPGLDANFVSSQELIQALLSGKFPFTININFGVCDVRDVALAHLRAMTLPDAAGHRFIVNQDTVNVRDIAKVLSDEFSPMGYKIATAMLPDWLARPLSYIVPDLSRFKGRFGAKNFYSNEKLRKILNIEPIDWKTSVLSSAYSLVERGAVEKKEGYEVKKEYLKY